MLQLRPRSVLWWFALITIGNLICAWWFVGFLTNYGENIERRALLATATAGAAAFDGAKLATLKGGDEDRGTPAFQHARESLQLLRSAIPLSRFAYLMAVRDDEVIFLADAEAQDSPDYSPPGSVYPEASPALRQVFETKTAITEGPLSDIWGVWVSGLVPVLDQTTGNVVAVFGVDISAAHWQLNVSRFYWLGIAISGFVTGLIGLFGLLIYRQYRLGAMLVMANRIVEDSTTFLYHLGDGPSQPLTFVSSNVEKLGYSSSELIAAPDLYRSLIHPDDRARVEEGLRRLSMGSSVDSADAPLKISLEFRIADASGTYHWMESRHTPTFDATGRLVEVAGVLIDITERKAAEEKLQVANTLLTTLKDTSPDAILGVDANQQIIAYNRQFMDLWRLPPDLLDARTDEAALAEAAPLMKDPEGFVARIQYIYAHPEESAREDVETADGRLFDQHTSPLRTADGRYLGRVWFFRDITEHKRAVEAVRVTLERVQRQMHFIGVLSKTQSLLSGDVDVLARQITEEVARILGCERVNVWLFNDEETELRCIDLYEASSGAHSADMVLLENEYRAEFQTLKENAYIAADDPLTDPRTVGYVETYLKPLRITSMLDAVIVVGGRNLGLLCFEHVDRPHHWEQDEIAFALQLADKLGLAIVSQHRRIEEERRRISEAALAEAQEVAHLGNWSYDPQRDVATFSEEGYHIMGANPATFNHSYQAYLSRIHPDDRVKFECGFAESVANHTRHAVDYRMRMDDSRVKWVHDIGRHSYDTVGCHVRSAGTMQDITERKLSEDALAESELKFKTILDTAVDGIVLADEQTRTFVQCNRAFAAMIGYDPEEIAALGVADIHPDAALPEVDRLFRRMTQGKSKVASELPIKRKDGSIFFADMSGSPMKLGGRNYLVAVFHDVTERRQAALALRQERDFTTAVIDSLPGLFVLIDEKARLVRWNQNLPALTGISDEKLQGRDAFGIVVESDRATAREKLTEAFKQGLADVEFRVPAKNGDLRTIYLSGRAITSDEHRYMVAVGIDITERKAAEEKLQFANTLLTTLKDTSPDAILVVDADQRIISVNKQFVEMWRLPPGLVDTLSDATVLAAVAAAIKDPDAFVARVHYLYEHPEEAARDEVELTDGRFIDRHTDVLRTSDGRYLGRVWFFRDVTEAKRAEAKITQMARFDNLTGLANRGVFVEALQQAIAWAQRNATQTFAVLYLDLDHFKDVNDTLGHPIGDLLLQEVGQRLLASIRETDTVARFGGDEFAIILFDIRDPDDAAVLAGKIMKTIGDPFLLQGNAVHSGASVGIAVYGPDSLDAEALLSHADVALYRAKAEGRGTYRFFTDAMDAEVHIRVTMDAELRDALTLQQLFLLYQPQVEIETGRIVGLEALVRWRHPKRGIIAPEEFIPIAEKSGLIVALGQWVMREVCRQTKQWLDAGIVPSSVAFNLSGVQFKTALKLENDIAAILEETGVPPRYLELELTESVLMDASLEHNDVLIRLRQTGLRIAIDDFGTGYSSLDYLRRFPVNRIKIAQTFVRDLGTVENTAIVRAALGLARALGIEMIVEGVETLAQLELLRSLGCEYVQGYYFSKPLSVSEATSLLRVGTICKSQDTI